MWILLISIRFIREWKYSCNERVILKFGDFFEKDELEENECFNN